MKHVTLRSSSATNAGSGQASGKHSQLSLFPFCHCCHPQFLTQFLCGSLNCNRSAGPLPSCAPIDLSPMVTLLYATPLHSLYIIYFFFFYFVFVFRFVCGFTDCREAFARLFSPCFVFFSVFFVTCEVVKVKIDFHFIAACAWAPHKGWAKGDWVLGSVHSQHPLLAVSLSLFSFESPQSTSCFMNEFCSNWTHIFLVFNGQHWLWVPPCPSAHLDTSIVDAFLWFFQPTFCCECEFTTQFSGLEFAFSILFLAHSFLFSFFSASVRFVSFPRRPSKYLRMQH